MPDAPKLFTPIGAVSFTDNLNQPMSEKYVFYLDDNGILHDQHGTGDGDYKHGTLAGLKIQYAHYSALVAVTIKGRVVNHMCVFYQAPANDGAVKMVSLPAAIGLGNLGPPISETRRFTAPPSLQCLLAQAYSAVVSGQGTAEPLPLSGYDRDNKLVSFSPHTSLTAVDNGYRLHLIYKSHSGQAKMICIDPTQDLQLPEFFFHDVEVAPRSAIAECLAPNSRSLTSIVLFYQALDPDSRRVQLSARVVYRANTAATDTKWNVSEKDILGL